MTGAPWRENRPVLSQPLERVWGLLQHRQQAQEPLKYCQLQGLSSSRLRQQ